MLSMPKHEHKSTGIASGLEYRPGYKVGGRVGFDAGGPVPHPHPHVEEMQNPNPNVGMGILDLNNIMDVLDQHVLRWKEKELQYIPHASTWLNQKRFEDELEPLEKKISDDDKLEKKRIKFEKMMQQAEENIASDDERKQALGLK